MFSSKNAQRKYSLNLALRQLEEYILDCTEMCHKAFVIKESHDTDCNTGFKEYYFKFREIPIEIQHVTIPSKSEITILPRKYNLKERIRILFRGE